MAGYHPGRTNHGGIVGRPIANSHKTTGVVRRATCSLFGQMLGTRKKSRTETSPKSAEGSEAVDQFLQRLTHPLKQEIETLRRIILKADTKISEGIKWNAPSFYYNDWFATFDLRSQDWVQIIFHRGAKSKQIDDSHYVQDPKSILKWVTNDRCVARFVSKSDVESKKTALRQIVAEWVGNMASQ